MDLRTVHRILLVASKQPNEWLKVRGPHLTHEVEQMTIAGLVDSTRGNDGEQFIAINRLTEAGHKFLRAFKEKRIPNAAALRGGTGNEEDSSHHGVHRAHA
jgi:hypothetical protein